MRLATTAWEKAAVAEAMGPEGDLVPSRLARGCQCYAAFRDREVAGYGWRSGSAEWIGEVGLEISPGPGEAYIWNCVTLPRYRRQGVFRAILAAMCGDLRFRRLWIASLEGTAEAVLPPLGFQPLLRIGGDRIEGDDVGFAVLGLRRGEPLCPGAPRRH